MNQKLNTGEKPVTDAMKRGKPEHSYIARKRCGCVCGICVDDPDDPDMVAESLSRWVKRGASIERVHDSDLRPIFDEPTFLKCNHGQLVMEL